MSSTAFFAGASQWWPYVFILLGGWLPTYIWRFLGVIFAGRIRQNSSSVALVRAIATSLVAAVIARLVLYPSGALAEIPDVARLSAMAAGFMVYLMLGRSIVLGIVVAELLLLGGALLGS